jgi:pentatricopeptide repeat protein
MLFKDCIHKKDLIEGKLVHAHMIKNGIQPDIFLRNSLINMYAKCDDLVGAKNEFDNFIERDQVSWNAIIAAYARHGELKEAVELFRQMGRANKKADHFTFGSILVACSNLRVPKMGIQLHTHSIKTGFELHVSVGCSLVNMYAKCNSVEDARQVFDKMPERNVVSWTAMITGYALQECGDEAMELFELMQWTDIGLNKFIFTSVLSAFAHPQALEQGKQIHVHAIKNGLEMDVSVGNALVTMYANCGSIDDALQAFKLASRHDLVSWNAMITGYAQNVHGEKALNLFCEMQHSGLKPNQFTFVSVLKACAIQEALDQGKQIHSYILKLGFEAQIFVGSALVDMYAKCGSIEKAHRGFDEMPEKDMVSWTTLIAGYMQNGNGEEVMSLFCQMEHAGIKPNQYTLTCVLRACASLAGLEQGKQVHGHIYKIGLNMDVSVGSALTTMYAKGGSIDDAWEVFDKMPTRDVVSWNSIIAGYSQHGRGEEALQLFGHMQQTGKKPDDITFINVLSACSHGGLVDQGWHYFNSMIHDHNIIPRIDHYGCMVDILGRGGYLEKAEDFINNASFDHKAPLWRILLGACRTHGKVEIAKRAAEYILELEAPDSTTYVLLSNIYAAAGRWSDVEKVRKLMKDKGVKKEPGRSWIQVNNRVHVFVVGDRSHPQTDDIYATLERLAKVLKDAGYVPDTKSVLHDLDQEKKCYNPVSG